MTLPKTDSSSLSADSQTRLELFYRRFCEGRLRRQYGLGHLLYACHASFPLVLSPELANLVYINFNNYSYYNGIPGKIDATAPSDFLLSPLCRRISSRQFEVLPDIRSYLLHLLKDGRWFYHYGLNVKGDERLQELAEFLQQYVAVKLPGNSNEGTGFKRLNEWAALAYSNPQELARRIGEVLDENKQDDQGQLWLNSQMERIEKQFNFDIHNRDDSKSVLAPFFNLYHYSQARKGEMFGKGDAYVFDNAAQIINLPSVNGNGTSISLPLARKIADRTERRLNNVQKVLSLLIGIDKYEQNPLRGCVYGAGQLGEILTEMGNRKEAILAGGPKLQWDTSNVSTLLDEMATKENILGKVKTTLGEADPEDICLLYFAGHGENRSFHTNRLYPVDHTRGKDLYLTPPEFLQAVEEGRKKSGCQVVWILDSHTGYYKWLKDTDILLGGVRFTMQTEKQFDGENTESVFFHSLSQILKETKGRITYRHLLQWLRFTIKNVHTLRDETPVLMTSIPNLDNYFLQKGQRNTDDAPLIACNSVGNRWEVLPEDFKLIALQTPVSLREYDSGVLVEHTRGQIFLQDGRFCFDGNSDALNPRKLYRLKIWSPLLTLYCSDQVNQYLAIERILAELRFGAYSKWRGIDFRGDDPVNANTQEYLLFKDTGQGYQLTFQHGAVGHASSEVHNIKVRDLSSLKDTILKFATYHYLCNLKQPDQPNNVSLNQPGRLNNVSGALSVSFRHRWLDWARESDFTMRPLVINESAFSINGNELTFIPLELKVSNEEQFPVFCTVCLLASNLQILTITAPELSPLLPNTSLVIELAQPKFFEMMLTEELIGQIKLLISRDPVPVDFSQNAIVSTITR